MSVKLYMDHHVARAITAGLRLRKVDVLTAFEDGASRIDDSDLLKRAGALNRVLFTQDQDLLIETSRLQRQGITFQGIIYAHQRDISTRICIDDLELIAQAAEPEDFENRVVYLPL